MYSLWAIYLFATAAYTLDLPECKHHECAEYKVIKKTDNYEVRRYESYKIATVTSKGVPLIVANYFNFMKLFKYINGHNEESKRMKMTAPILNMSEKTGKPIKDETEMAFFMSAHLDGEPPKPTDEKVEIKDFGPVTVYAVRFGGYMCPHIVGRLQQKLHDDLKADGVEFDESLFMTAGYNQPMQLFHRHNDVFYLGAE